MGKTKPIKRKPSDMAQAIRIQVLQRTRERVHRGGFTTILFIVFLSVLIGAFLGSAFYATNGIFSVFFTLLTILSLLGVLHGASDLKERLNVLDGLDHTIARISKDIYGEKMWDPAPEPKTKR